MTLAKSSSLSNKTFQLLLMMIETEDKVVHNSEA